MPLSHSAPDAQALPAVLKSGTPLSMQRWLPNMALLSLAHAPQHTSPVAQSRFAAHSFAQVCVSLKQMLVWQWLPLEHEAPGACVKP